MIAVTNWHHEERIGAEQLTLNSLDYPGIIIPKFKTLKTTTVYANARLHIIYASPAHDYRNALAHACRPGLNAQYKKIKIVPP
jgi:hypothetical protein